MPTSVFAARIGATTRDLDLLGERVHVLELGPPDGPPAVFVHGASGGAGWFWRNAPALAAAGHRVILPDLPGFGRSSRPPAISFGLIGSILAELLRALRVERADLIGFSMGGAAATTLALERPDLVRRLVLVSSAGLGPELGLPFRALALPILGERLLRPNPEATRRFHRRWLFGKPERVDEEMVWYDHASLHHPGSARAILSLVRPLPRRFWRATIEGQAAVMLRDRLAALRRRTLIVWGRRDRIFPVAHAHEAAGRIAGARVEVLEEAGHVPHFEEPARFNDAVRRFLGER
jgi:4,5:9,10-diseco-3-hydroxy-5,9,17-trioxoandrosta-1(10),2-diene-4-oate hydrolase